MKRSTKLFIGLLGIVLLGVALLSLDLAQNSLAQSDTPEQEAASSNTDITTQSDETEEEVTVEDEAIFIHHFDHMIPQEAVEAALATAVTDNILTQAEADQILADIDSSADALLSERQESFSLRLEGDDASIAIRPFGGPHGHGHDLPLMGGGFFGALRQAVTDDIITEEDMRQIMLDFAEFAGEGVMVEFGDENEGESNNIEITIEGMAENLRQAQEAALDKAVEDGRLTREEADTILEQVSQPPSDITLPFHPGRLPEIIIDGEHRPFGQRGLHLLGHPPLDILSQHLEEAVADGKLTQAEADELLETLQDVFTE